MPIVNDPHIENAPIRYVLALQLRLQPLCCYSKKHIANQTWAAPHHYSAIIARLLHYAITPNLLSLRPPSKYLRESCAKLKLLKRKKPKFRKGAGDCEEKRNLYGAGKTSAKIGIDPPKKELACENERKAEKVQIQTREEEEDDLGPHMNILRSGTHRFHLSTTAETVTYTAALRSKLVSSSSGVI
ncbi:hypothetical protein VNO78_25145 [Psophocarpus tetragonolobus]|uniref:Uncharacterized protein n=1 Tax=Psophocarpus tetragonolobus TaxID=3891 RepID=A0AAN9XF11_PSOTE